MEEFKYLLYPEKSKCRRKISKRGLRRSSGSLLAETALALMVMIPFLGLGLDAVFGLMAYQILDSGCRDAARAAAQALSDPANSQNPGDLAQNAANAALQVHNFGSLNMTAKVVSYNFAITDTENNFYLVNPQSGSLIQPLQGPYVTVQTSMSYKLPFPVISFGNTITTGQLMHFQQTYSFPILVPALPVGAAAPAT